MANKGNSTTPVCERCRFISSINDILPDDILVQILCCLPCKFAVTCKLVCKHWVSLISTPRFISCSISHHIKNGQQQHDDDDVEEKYDPMILKTSDRYLFLTSSQPSVFDFRIVASSDDLFLCTRWSMYFIRNAFTKESFELPPPPPPPPTTNSFDMYIYGFTHKPYYHREKEKDGSVLVNSSCRFCVARFKIIIDTQSNTSLREASEFEVDIFSSETWQWTTSMMQHSSRPDSPLSCISRNGLLHWLCYHGQVIIHDPFSNKVCHVVDQLPQDSSPHAYSFRVSQGCLLAFNKCHSKISVWELEDHEDQQQPQWRFVTSSVDLSSIEMWTIAVHPNDKNIIYFKTGSGEVAALSLRTGKVVTTGSNYYGYEVRSFKMDIVNEMVVYKTPCWPTPVSALLNSRRLASST